MTGRFTEIRWNGGDTNKSGGEPCLKTAECCGLGHPEADISVKMLRLDGPNGLLPAEDPGHGGVWGVALLGRPEQAEIKQGSKVDLMKLHKTNEVTGIQL